MCNNIVVGIHIDTVLLGPLKSNSEKESLLPMGCKEKEWNGKRLLPARQTDTGMWNATARQLLNGSPFFVLLRNSISCTPNTRKKRELNLERPRDPFWFVRPLADFAVGANLSNIYSTQLKGEDLVA